MEQNTQIQQPKLKKRKIITAIVFIIIFLAVVYFGWTQYSAWWQVRKEYVKMGFAEDKFPYRMYTERELVEKGLWSGESPALNAVPTRTTPEETYAIFRQALIDGDFDKAVECFIKSKQAEYKDALIKAKEEERIDEIIKKLTEISPEGERITVGSIGDSSTSYEFFYKEKEDDEKFTSHTIVFYKDWNGDWLMDNL